MFLVLWRRGGRRAALTFGSLGLIWLASFGLNYWLNLRYTSGSSYLREYWSSAMPPATAGIRDTVTWLAGQLQPFAAKPGGSGLWILFWASAVAGYLVSARLELGLALGLVPLSMFALAGLRIVPLYERISLWALPAVYVGIALLADGAAHFGRVAIARRASRRVGLTVVAGVVALAPLAVCAEIVQRGIRDMTVARAADSNHELDDRAGVRWLMAQRQPGDAILTTRLALPAVWWYGGIPITSRDSVNGLLNGHPIFQVGHVEAGRDCRPNAVREALQGRSRALVYFGFRFDDMPSGFDQLLLDSLRGFGAVTHDERFARAGRSVVVDLRRSADTGLPDLSLDIVRPSGCIAIRPAQIW
jgi:hypothetical protein